MCCWCWYLRFGVFSLVHGYSRPWLLGSLYKETHARGGRSGFGTGHGLRVLIFFLCMIACRSIQLDPKFHVSSYWSKNGKTKCIHILRCSKCNGTKKNQISYYFITLWENFHISLKKPYSFIFSNIWITGPFLIIGVKDGWDSGSLIWSKTLMELIFNPCGEFLWSPKGRVS